MRIDHFPNWQTQSRATTDPNDTRSPMAGIAIAPSSTEGVIIVDGVRLQSGRILPVRQTTYTIERARPLTAKLSDTTDKALDTISDLSLVIFEDAAELGCEVARANGGPYLGPRDWTFGSVKNGSGLVMQVPFIGRRQCEFIIKSTDEGGAFHYTVIGVKWDPVKNELWRWPLHVSGAVNLDATFKTLAFYIGGTDNAENWDVLELVIDDGAGGDPGGHWNVLAETIGDIGAR